jgi:transposase
VLSVTGRLDEIPGVGPDVAQVIVAELGMDMTQFPTPGHAAGRVAARAVAAAKEGASFGGSLPGPCTVRDVSSARIRR